MSRWNRFKTSETYFSFREFSDFGKLENKIWIVDVVFINVFLFRNYNIIKLKDCFTLFYFLIHIYNNKIKFVRKTCALYFIDLYMLTISYIKKSELKHMGKLLFQFFFILFCFFYLLININPRVDYQSIRLFFFFTKYVFLDTYII